MSLKVWGVKTLCLVTGASQGIGRAIAEDFCKRVAPSSTFLLTARSNARLLETKEALLAVAPSLNVVTESLDLSKPDMASFKTVLSAVTNQDYDLYLLIHNVGSEGDGKLTTELSDLNEWISYMSLNLFHVTMLTSAWLEAVPSSARRTIVNITSLAAVQPLKGLSQYCIGKASREMYFRALAEENPALSILNYSPGPVDTDMITRVISSLKDDGTKAIFSEMKEGQKLVKAVDTIAYLSDILAAGKFQSGGRIDYMDKA